MKLSYKFTGLNPDNKEDWVGRAVLNYATGKVDEHLEALLLEAEEVKKEVGDSWEDNMEGTLEEGWILLQKLKENNISDDEYDHAFFIVDELIQYISWLCQDDVSVGFLEANGCIHYQLHTDDNMF